MELRIADASEDWDAWEKFNLEHGNVFQSRGFAGLLKETGTETGLLIATEDSKIIGGALYFLPLSGIKKVFSELRVVSGPVVDNVQTFAALLAKLEDIAIKNKVISIQIRTPFSDKREVFTDAGYSLSKNAPTHSFNVIMTGKKEDIRKKLDKKTRNSITKAEKSGIVVKETDNASLVYSLYMDRAAVKKDQIPIPLSYFKAMKGNLQSKFLVAEYNGKAIAESVFLVYGNKIYYFNNGSLPEYWKYNPNELLVWKMIEMNAGSGKILNLYGVPDGSDKDHPSYGIYKFKSGFGGELIEEFTYASKIISPTKKKVFDLAVKYFLPLYKRLIA